MIDKKNFKLTPLKAGLKDDCGQMIVEDIKVEERVKDEVIEVKGEFHPAPSPTMLMFEYLRSGWQINLIVAIDYTASNGY